MHYLHFKKSVFSNLLNFHYISSFLKIKYFEENFINDKNKSVL